ncbi:MAG: mannose-1-phosphate guanylyltransferase/mannose-6-phosphate isomerase [Burkholderiales bacterium]
MLIPVILSGGSGTRLWPVSREAFPKPFMKLGGGLSLLQRTLSRCLPLADGRRVGIVTNKEYLFKTREEIETLPAARGTRCTQLLEPIGRNTAPAVAMAALWAESVDADATLLVLPADHLIPDEAAFQAVARQAAAIAASGSLVLFGIRPTAPETGFGYIETGEPVPGTEARCVARFVEKPDAARALEFLAAGTFVWNSGMFCFTARAILAALEAHAPDVLAQARAAWAASRATATDERVAIDAAAFGAVRDVSIDYAVMEKAKDVVVLPASFGWSDIGSWKAVSEQFVPDADGNTTVGEAMFVDARNTHVQSDDRLVAAVGVDNLLVVDTPDALLVASKDASQQVKEIVTRLKSRGHEAARLHRTVARPWGTYTVLQEGSRFKIKRIEVKPGQTLSLQMHHHRSEHWIVVSGTAKVSCDDRTFLVAANESTYIPIGTRHRLENPGVMDLVMIEVQCGDYLGEDDIVRFEDKYGRTA